MKHGKIKLKYYQIHLRFKGRSGYDTKILKAKLAI